MATAPVKFYSTSGVEKIRVASRQQWDQRRHSSHATPCSVSTPPESLNIWPPFPLALCYGYCPVRDCQRQDNILAALQLRDRVSAISFELGSYSCLKSFLPAMQEPLPALTFLCLCQHTPAGERILPETFLGGSALGRRSISGITQTPFVHQSPCDSSNS